MIITYPDEITHAAICSSIMDLIRDMLPTGSTTIPSFKIIPGETFSAEYESQEDEDCFNSFIENVYSFKNLVDKNMAF
jgi:hypothetical protein